MRLDRILTRRWVTIAAGMAVVILLVLVWMQRPKSVEYETIEIPLPEGFASFGDLKINDCGVVAGTLRGLENQSDHLFLWDRDKGLKDLGNPGFVSGQALLEVRDINNNGQLIGEFGFYVSDDGTHFRGNTQSVGCFFFDPETGFREIGGLKGFWSPRLSAMNDRGQVAGYCFRDSIDETNVSRIFLWNWQSGTVDPNLVGWPRDISNSGDIVGCNGKTSYIWSQTGKELDRIENGSDEHVVANHVTESDEVYGVTYRLPFRSDSVTFFRWNRIEGYQSFHAIDNPSNDDFPVIAENGREILFYKEHTQFDWFGLIDDPQVHIQLYLYTIGGGTRKVCGIPKSKDILRLHMDMNNKGWLTGIVNHSAYVIIPKRKGKKEGD